MALNVHQNMVINSVSSYFAKLIDSGEISKSSHWYFLTEENIDFLLFFVSGFSSSSHSLVELRSIHFEKSPKFLNIVKLKKKEINSRSSSSHR